MDTRIKEKYIPMTETAFYLLLALRDERHGYGAMQYIQHITDGRLRIGPGTVYGTLSKMEKDSLIRAVNEYDRRKTYQQTRLGEELLAMALERLEEMVRNARKEIG